MAKLIPRIKIDEIQNKPERDTARSLVEQLPDEAVVFHSYPWLRTTGAGRDHIIIEGEADFCVIIWDIGFLVLEVKGGEIAFEPEYMEWFRILPNRRKKIKDPFKQASTSLHHIKDKIQNDVFPGQTGLPFGFGYAVVFPDCNYAGDTPPGADHAVILSARDLPFFDRRIPDIIKSWRRSGRPLSSVESKKIMSSMSSSFNLVPLLSRQFEDEYDTLVRLTKEQSGVLKMLERHSRCLIEGVAGSGKTMLAIERARRFANEGKRVLVVCYNITLAAWLSECLTAESNELINVYNFHRLCEEMCGKAGIDFVPEGNFNTFFRDIAPEKLLEAAEILGPQFDALVVDEGQDFQESWWMPLELMCREAEASPFYVFYDRDQNLFVDKLVLPDLGEPYFLNNNCRNTRNIAETCARIRGIEIDLHWAAPAGRNVEIKVCPDTATQLKEAAAIVKQFRNGGLQPNQIAILSPYTHGNDKYSFSGIQSLDKFALTDSVEEWKKGLGILYATIKSFKGLEADAVILVDIPDPEKNKYFTVNDLYVGASRAKHFLAILTRDDFIQSQAERSDT